MSNADGAGVQSVDRALTILEGLARSGEAGVTEIANEIGVHKSTAFRLVATLEAHRLVEQTEERGKYRLGVGLLRLAGATTARLDLVQEARPVCRQLATDTGETVNIAVLSESSALYLDQVAGSSALQPHNWVGQHIPLHATSNG
jgi:DNA-binding IclR family transcriptional regulator